MNNLKYLLEKACGNRTQNEYALHSKVSSAMITQIKNGDRKNPSPIILKKLADRAYNDVTYKQLMVAAGYWTEEDAKNQNISADINLSPKQQQAIDLLKQIDESNLNTVIGFLEGALRIQDEIKQTKSN